MFVKVEQNYPHGAHVRIVRHDRPDRSWFVDHMTAASQARLQRAFDSMTARAEVTDVVEVWFFPK